MKVKYLLIILVAVILDSCSPNKRYNQTAHKDTLHTVKYASTSPIRHVLSRNETFADTGNISSKPAGETVLRYPAFTLVIHGFKGYEFTRSQSLDEDKDSILVDPREAVLNLDELYIGNEENKNYREALIVKCDTIHLDETIDGRLVNNLIEIIPANKSDRFKVSWQYIGSVNEMLPPRKRSESLEQKLIKNLVNYPEITNNMILKDSANFYFRAFPHTPDMVEVTVKNKKVVPVNAQNIIEQNKQEAEFYINDRNRIKAKYKMHDTSVIFHYDEQDDGEATLTHNKRLFEYSYTSILFKVERLFNKNIVETKYISIAIWYGC